MPTSIGAAIDQIVALCQTACPSATVADGYPLNLGVESLVVAVGGTADPDADGGETPNQIGGYQLREEYDVVITIEATSGDTVQKTLRDLVLDQYNAIIDAWRGQMLTRTGLVAAVELCWPGQATLKQTDADTLANGEPWFARMIFQMHVIYHNT